MTDRPAKPKPRHSFRTFFFRGLGILLPTILTIWILVTVINFMYEKIAVPINAGVQKAIIVFSPWPSVTDEEIAQAVANLTDAQKQERQQAANVARWDRNHAEQVKLRRWWNSATLAGYPVMDLIGLLIAAILVYMVGLILGSFFGRRILARLEQLVKRIPLFKQVYPYVKQVTDFIVGSENKEKFKFSRVVAVQYPRFGLWSVGLVTGDTMRTLQDKAAKPCITVFIPSSPTPFTGYVITVPVADTVELPVTIDDALRFVVSGGVLVPNSQLIIDGSGGMSHMEAHPPLAQPAEPQPAGHDSGGVDRGESR